MKRDEVFRRSCLATLFCMALVKAGAFPEKTAPPKKSMYYPLHFVVRPEEFMVACKELQSAMNGLDYEEFKKEADKRFKPFEFPGLHDYEAPDVDAFYKAPALSKIIACLMEYRHQSPRKPQPRQTPRRKT